MNIEFMAISTNLPILSCPQSLSSARSNIAVCKQIKHSMSRTRRPTLGVILKLRTKWKCQLHDPATLTLGNNLVIH